MATARKKKPAVRPQRINFRPSAKEEQLIRMGTEKLGQHVSRFIIESACGAAAMALADERHFRLPAAQVAHLAEALDRPARVIPKLRNLLSKKPVIEKK